MPPAAPEPGPPGLVLAPASYDDAEVQALTGQLQAYYLRIYPGPDTSPMTATEFAPPAGLFLLGRQGGVPVAMGGWRREDGLDALGGRRVAELRRMFTVPGARRSGVARALLRELERTAAAGGADVLVLSTGRPQHEALAFYRACGYVDVAPFGYYGAVPGVVCLGRRLTG